MVRVDQHPFPDLGAFADFTQEVIDLGRCRAHDDLGIDQAGRPDQLLHDLAGVAVLVIRRGCRNEDRLPQMRFELGEL